MKTRRYRKSGVLEHVEHALGRKPSVHGQGKVVAEEQRHGEYLVMFPDGMVEHAMNKAQAEQKAKKWFRDNAEESDLGVGAIEWRHRTAGIGPLPQKGQFSQLPSDVWVEVDGGHQIGNENEFPPDPAKSQEKAIIDEVNMLRNDVSQRAASDKDAVEFKGLLHRLETEGKRIDKGDKLTEMLAPEKFSFRTKMIIRDLISLMEDDPGLKELVPESLRGFFEGYRIAWDQQELWKHAMVSRRATIAKEFMAGIPRYGIENLPEGVPQPPHAERNNVSKIIVEKIEAGRIRNEYDVIEEIKNFEKDYGLRDTPEGNDIWNWFKKHQAKLLAMGRK